MNKDDIHYDDYVSAYNRALERLKNRPEEIFAAGQQLSVSGAYFDQGSQEAAIDLCNRIGT